MSVLSSNEYKTIRSLTQHSLSPTLSSPDAKETRRLQSKQRTQRWPMNALQKRDLEKSRRLAEMEAVQTRLDEREHQLREQEKRETIARANRMMYQENDRVKTFRSSMILSNSMHERQAQEEYKKYISNERAEYERQQDEQIKNMMDQALQREKEDKLKQERTAAEVARIRDAQIRDKARRFKEEREQEILEAAYMRQQAIDAEREAIAMEQLRARNAKVKAGEFVKANQEQMRLRARLAQVDDVEDDVVKRHAEERDRMDAMRRAAEAQRRKEKQSVVDTLIEKQQGHLSAVKAEEEARLNREFEAMNFKAAEKERMLADHRSKLQDDLYRGRSLQMRRQAEERLRKEEEEKMMLKDWHEANERALQREKDEEAKEAAAALALQDTLRSQIRGRQQQEMTRRHEQTLDAQRASKMREYDDKVFNQYTAHYIEKFDQEGKNTLPLKLAAHRIENKAMKL